ncbi:hypothetical protein BV22DRAFT_1040468 [Leucogyrophana mollusca]|uniref:Uncharacterized protein n=1 Tax=Leucogyrophana mollusca TaxID=85980 RepID=A0ACB8B4A2_9AGAM|nr:hypothetical protein BV22DRAFT_1040468 [Leucogyrophana mollusca]
MRPRGSGLILRPSPSARSFYHPRVGYIRRHHKNRNSWCERASFSDILLGFGTPDPPTPCYDRFLGLILSESKILVAPLTHSTFFSFLALNSGFTRSRSVPNSNTSTRGSRDPVLYGRDLKSVGRPIVLLFLVILWGLRPEGPESLRFFVCLRLQ